MSAPVEIEREIDVIDWDDLTPPCALHEERQAEWISTGDCVCTQVKACYLCTPCKEQGEAWGWCCSHCGKPIPRHKVVLERL